MILLKVVRRFAPPQPIRPDARRSRLPRSWRRSPTHGLYRRTSALRLFLPRVGHRVEVHFAENDPDRPTIEGLINSTQLMPFDAAENPKLGGVFTPAHRFMFNSDPNDLWIKLQSPGDTEESILGERVFETGKDRSEIVGGSADWLVRKDVHWSVLGSCLNQVADNFRVEAESLILQGSKRIVLMVAGNFIMIDSGGITINGKPLHFNPPGASAPSAPSNQKGKAKRKTKLPKPRKERK